MRCVLVAWRNRAGGVLTVQAWRSSLRGGAEGEEGGGVAALFKTAAGITAPPRFRRGSLELRSGAARGFDISTYSDTDCGMSGGKILSSKILSLSDD